MTEADHEIGSGNVFADLGIPDADDHLIKAQLARKIGAILEERGLTQVAAAELLGVTQPDISNLLRGRFRQFSVERLLRFLVALGRDIEIVVTPHLDQNSPPTLRLG